LKTGPTGLTVYIGGVYERRSANGKPDTHVFHVVGESSVADIVWEATAGAVQSEEVLFLHRDHLGSVETISRPDGTIKERRKYDPFGARVNPTDMLG
jgi:hypothetical protein